VSYCLRICLAGLRKPTKWASNSEYNRLLAIWLLHAIRIPLGRSYWEDKHTNIIFCIQKCLRFCHCSPDLRLWHICRLRHLAMLTWTLVNQYQTEQQFLGEVLGHCLKLQPLTATIKNIKNTNISYRAEYLLHGAESFLRS